MEANYPYAIKNQRGASKIPLVGGFGYGIRLLDAGAGNILELSTNESGEDWSVDLP